MSRENAPAALLRAQTHCLPNSPPPVKELNVGDVKQAHTFLRNPPQCQSGWYCSKCDYFTPKVTKADMALVCRVVAKAGARP